ncbi:hypothetical protein KY306_02580, partial [Candidatus Woesearchaeota archaeon]|nr:hypothetical protein [Candidatus Woesearchaeota archaeon]
MDRDLEVANQIFEKILRDVPYNSATSMYVIAGKEYPARFGINCIGQSLILREKLKEADFTESVILRDLVFGRHCPLLLKINGERYYVDPYLMGYCPINLEEILGSQRKEKEFEAFPSLNGTASRLFFS